MPRSRTIWKDGQLFAEYAGDELVWLNPEYRPPARSSLSAPMVLKDIGAYTSPIDGTLITSRSHHRDHMRRHDVIEVGNERLRGEPPPTVSDRRETIQRIKHHVEQVAAMPQAQYDTHVQQQRAENESVAALVTPS